MATAGVFPTLTVPFKLSVGSTKMSTIKRPKVPFIYEWCQFKLCSNQKNVVGNICWRSLREIWQLAITCFARVRLHNMTMSRSMNLNFVKETNMNSFNLRNFLAHFQVHVFTRSTEKENTEGHVQTKLNDDKCKTKYRQEL